MSDTKKKYIDAVSKMIRLTQEHKITWVEEKSSNSNRLAFQNVMERKKSWTGTYKLFNLELTTLHSPLTIAVDQRPQVTLILQEPLTGTAFEFPNLPILSELAKAVEKVTEDAESDILEKFLREDNKGE